MKYLLILLFIFAAVAFSYAEIPDTGQTKCYNNTRQISCPHAGGSFYGQDGNYQSAQPKYTDNGDGTVTDLVTGLMWTKRVDSEKVSLAEARKMAKNISTGGYSDWRVPDIKELYSLIDFNGYTGFSGPPQRQGFEKPIKSDEKPRDGFYKKGGSGDDRTISSEPPDNAIPFINTNYFDFKFGQTGERYIDAQWLTTTEYVYYTMNGAKTLFGVNFADGRIKGYGYSHPRRNNVKKFYVRFVRGDTGYGVNDFVDNGDKTITDRSSGLMWTKSDSGRGFNWEDALDYAERLDVAGYNDWRLPNAKELQYIVDYTRSPDTTNSPAINALFQLTAIKNEAGQKDYAYYWTSTTHMDGPKQYSNAAYIAFGRAIGKMHGEVMDVHGAGAQRSDPKDGSPEFRGPQGDAIRGKNYVLAVRNVR